MGFEVKIGTVRQLAVDISDNANELATARTAVVNVRKSCAIRTSSRQNILRALQAIEADLQEEEASIKSLGSSLLDIVSLYEGTEKNIAGTALSSGNGTGTGNDTASDIWKWSDTWKVIASFGGLGAFVAMLGNLVTGGTDAGNILSALKFLAKAVGATATACTKGDTAASWWKFFSGFNDATEEFAGSSFGDAFTSSLNKQFTKDLDIGNATNVGDEIKVVAKWAGHALTVAKNGVENYQEYKSGDISEWRAIVETAVESAVDIGIGALATAGITAAAVAAGIAAPAVAIGVGAVVVTWVVNGICKWLTGDKDIGEVAADAVCDIGEAAIPVVKSGLDDALDRAKTMINDIGKAISSEGDLVTSVSTRWSKGIFAFA